jgi:ABC-type multidrug transport system fused ATPase/permease subunit
MSLFIFVISAIVAYTQIMLNKWALSPNAKSNIYFYIQLLLNVVKFVLALLMTWVMHVSRIYQSLHDDMIRSLLFSPLSYFEKTPSDKIINRLSTHISMNDKIMTSEFGFMLANLQLTLSYLFSVIYVYIVMERYYHMVFLFVFSAITIFIFYEYFGIAMKINKLEREMLIPINSKYSEMIDGLTTIRAYDKVEFIVNEFWRNMNIFSLSTTIKSFIEAKLKLIIIGGPNLLIILQLFSVVFLDLSFSENTVFLIFSYFGFEDSLMRFYQGLAAYAPRL